MKRPSNKALALSVIGLCLIQLVAQIDFSAEHTDASSLKGKKVAALRSSESPS